MQPDPGWSIHGRPDHAINQAKMEPKADARGLLPGPRRVWHPVYAARSRLDTRPLPGLAALGFLVGAAALWAPLAKELGHEACGLDAGGLGAGTPAQGALLPPPSCCHSIPIGHTVLIWASAGLSMITKSHTPCMSAYDSELLTKKYSDTPLVRLLLIADLQGQGSVVDVPNELMDLAMKGSLNDVGSVDVFSWISCLDLRSLAVLTNSTLSSSSDPHNISFHYLIPEGGNDKLSYFKLKSKANQGQAKCCHSRRKFSLVIPHRIVTLSYRKISVVEKEIFYIAADSIIKGKVEDLGRMELGGYAIGAIEDCSKRLSDYISMDVLSAIQRAGAAFSWVPKEPYNEDACLLDFDVLLMEPRKLEKTLITSIMWWATGCLQQCRY
ncbi:hypothetical protein ZEAMMB73_Zm00001d026374 [Zea mays]|uniref:Uncharacterized protein n=1 Tax=Zea mays TaxID=4577 RepID=A0A1D6JF56_MAIZE|nr:hypothetical protein ZEAMMB73_Zm00001d026374 [Zea mays]AQK46421.1 hypothetical protein ZEAMMB73_Zm00001d026374 [Zea mays]